LESLQNKDLLDFTQQRKLSTIKFRTTPLPEDSEDLNLDDPRHLRYIEYLEKRGVRYDEYPYKVTPNATGNYGSRKENRIIIPYFYKSKIVGYTSRFIDNKTPKYLNVQQPGYVFNIDNQQQDYSVCIVTEGIFDAISIGGVALMHDDISSEQAQLLASLNRRIIVVPDFDTTGLKLIDRALEFGYSVSLPNWGPGVKDVNDAVLRYGKLPTLMAILQSATVSKIKLELRKKQIVKGI
jgi:DNA primase